MTSPELKISQYRTMHGKNPSAAWLAVACKITPHEAERLLSQGELFYEQKDEQATRSEIPRFPGTGPTSVGVSDGVRPMPSGIIQPKTGDDGRAGVQAPELSGNRAEQVSGEASVDTGYTEVQDSIPRPGLIDQLGWLDKALLWFANALQKIAFIVVSLADFVIECLFYSTFGPNDWTKLALASWGFVIVGAKLWAWSYGKRGLAIFCATLSVIGAVGIFNASMDAQATVAATSNAIVIEDPRLSIQKQIKGLNDNIESMTAERAKLADGSNPKQVLDYNTKINAANEQLPKLRAELAAIKPADIKGAELQLDAWAIFEQVSKKIGVKAQDFAFVFILLVAILIQWIIASTTPRKLRG